MDTRERVAETVREHFWNGTSASDLTDAILAIFAEEQEAAAKASHAYADDCESLRELLEDANEKLAWYKKRCDWYSGEIASISLGAENGKKWANTLLDDLRTVTTRAEAAEAREAKLREAARQALSDLEWIEKQVPKTNMQASILLLRHALAVKEE